LTLVPGNGAKIIYAEIGGFIVLSTGTRRSTTELRLKLDHKIMMDLQEFKSKLAEDLFGILSLGITTTQNKDYLIKDTNKHTSKTGIEARFRSRN